MSMRRIVASISMVVWIIPAVAYAHAAYESSDPADDSTVSSPPSRVTAEFTEPVVDDSYLSVYDPCGEQVDNGDSLVAGDRITITMSADKQGRYTVTFNVISAVDGHPTSGEFGFTSSGGAACPGAEPPEDEPDDEGSSEGNTGKNREASDKRAATGDAATGSDDRVAGRRETRTGREGKVASGPRSEKRQDRQEAGPSQPSTRRIRLAQAPNEDAEAQGIWDGIPLDGFLMAMAIAAAIGAAGGRIYANIMGPRR